MKSAPYCYVNIIISNDQSTIYKLPSGSTSINALLSPITPPRIHFCPNTFYSDHYINFINNLGSHQQFCAYFLKYKPIYFNRFKYLGKGFKLLYKRKRKLLNCIFGHSHLYWVKLQTVFAKRTRKYKFFFSVTNYNMYSAIINVLKKVKPINRYTLRGLRTYTHIWIKRKGRKSIATHF